MKKIALAVVTLGLMASLTACNKDTTAYDTTVAYNSCLLNGDYASAYLYTNLTDYEFVSESNFETMITNDYMYTIANPSSAEYSADTGCINVTYSDKSTEQIPVIPSAGKYLFDLSDLLMTDYEIPVFKGSKLTISGIEVGPQYISYSDEIYDYYAVDLASDDYEIVVVSDAFGTVKSTINPLYTVYEANSISDEMSSEIINSFAKNLQSMYDLIEKEPSSKKLQELLPESYLDKDVFKDFQSKMIKNRNLEDRYTSYHDVKVIVEPQKNTSAEVVSEGVISIPLTIEISWIVGEDYNYADKWNITLDLVEKESVGWTLYSDACIDDLFELKVR